MARSSQWHERETLSKRIDLLTESERVPQGPAVGMMPRDWLRLSEGVGRQVSLLRHGDRLEDAEGDPKGKKALARPVPLLRQTELDSADRQWPEAALRKAAIAYRTISRLGERENSPRPGH
jgi:hypothetical protein